jgi:hypothetical protein
LGCASGAHASCRPPPFRCFHPGSPGGGFGYEETRSSRICPAINFNLFQAAGRDVTRSDKPMGAHWRINCISLVAQTHAPPRDAVYEFINRALPDTLCIAVDVKISKASWLGERDIRFCGSELLEERLYA